MSLPQIQSDEREVLLSIYEGDECFKEIKPNVFQYRFGENDTPQSFILEVKWDETYPADLPNIEMDIFYNKHIGQPIKDKIVNMVLAEAEQNLGMSMTYTLFEYVKEHFEDLLNNESCVCADTEDNAEEKKPVVTENDEQDASKKVLKKEALTKAQKRRQWCKLDATGEKPRGWNWIDVVKHLSQTGAKSSLTSGS